MAEEKLKVADEDAMEEFLIPPRNFAMVERGIYRAEFPEARSIPFLDSLNLRSILYLRSKTYHDKTFEFFHLRGIRLFHLTVNGRKGSQAGNKENDIADALRILIDTRNHPILILCKPGKRTGSIVVGCLRKLQRWSMSSVMDEYRRFTENTRISDLEFIQALDMSMVKENGRPSETSS